MRDQVYDFGAPVWVERLAGYESSVEDHAKQRDGRKFGIEVHPGTHFVDAACDEVGVPVASGRTFGRLPRC